VRYLHRRDTHACDPSPLVHSLLYPSSVPNTCSFVLPDLDIDLLRLLLATFWKPDLQNAVFVICSDLSLIDRTRHAESAQELSSRPFRTMLLRLADRSSSSHDQTIVIDVDFQRFTIDARQVHRDQVA